ncbi:uncharacterized protein [Amphiura filiformis]|uniref:uncharacterized protein n=1 Tax=Amphiura filiformis TaxID=82378 RepID=UPI003B20E390
MSSNKASKPDIRVCCFPTGRKLRKRSKDVELKEQDQSNEDSSHTLNPVNVTSDDYASAAHHSVPNESPLYFTRENILETSPPILTPAMSTYLEKPHEETDALDVKRDHSSTVTSLDEVITGISLSGSRAGSVSSEHDNIPSNIHLECYSHEENEDDDDYRVNSENHLARDSMISASEEEYTTKIEQSEKTQRMSTISAFSMVSSGYGSISDKCTPLNTETSETLLDERAESGIESATSAMLNEMQNNQQRGNEQTTMNKKVEIPQIHPARDKNILANILTKIKETIESKNLKPEQLANISIQLPNFSGKYLTNKGGRIMIPGTRISLYVPPGALDAEDTSPILVFIYLHPKSSRNRSQYDGRKWLTPNVECGPHGLVFKKDVYLTMPHYAVNPTQWDFDGHQTKQQADGKTCSKTLRDAVVVNEYEVTMMLDHFCSHGCSGRPVSGSDSNVRRWMKAGISFHRQDDQHMQIKVKLCDIESSMPASMHTDSFPINESASNAYVIVKALDKEWQLDEDPFKEILTDALWNREPDVTFIAKLRDATQIVETASTVPCTVDVFQHNNHHRGVTLELQGNEDADGMKIETNDIQIQFLLEQDDIAPTADCGISNRGFSELCMHLENEDICGKDWKQLAEEIGFTEYQYIQCIERRAKVKNRSPAAMVLDLVFKNKDPLEALKGLSNIFYKMDHANAKTVVDKEIQAIREKQQEQVSLLGGGNHGQSRSRSSPSDSEDGGSKVSTTDDGYTSCDGSPARSFSLRTKVFLSSIPSKMGKFNIGSFKRKQKSTGKDGNELKGDASGQTNIAYEDHKFGEMTDGACCSTQGPGVSREAVGGTTDVDREIPGLSVPEIMVTTCEVSSTYHDGIDVYQKPGDVNDNEDESSVLELHHQGLMTTPSVPYGNRDSGISSISGGSRDSWKSVKSHELTVCGSTLTEEVF